MTYRLTDGSHTHDVVRYIGSWDEIGENLESALPGWKMISCDPGIVLGYGEESQTTRISVALANRIIELWEKAEVN